MKSFIVPVEMDGWRVEKACMSLFPGRTRSQWLELMAQGQIRIDGGSVAKGSRLKAGSELALQEIPPRADEWHPAWTDPDLLPVVFETGSVLVVDKPPGLPTLPLRVWDAPTAAGALYARFGIAGTPASEAGIVNRLDTGTSGLLLAGRTARAQEKLRQRMASHHVEKTYRALVHGRFPDGVHWFSGRVITTGGARVHYEHSDARDGGAGQLAVSRVTRLWEGDRHSLVEVVTRYGRRHQVRIQLADAGFPLFNDGLYGQNDGWPETEHFLWAFRLTFADPETDAPHTVFSRSLPAHWLELAHQMGFLQTLGPVEAFVCS